MTPPPPRPPLFPYTTLFRSSLNYNYIAWNNRNPLFRDKRVRRALSMCMPIEAIVKDLYHGTARAMSGHFVPRSEEHTSELQSQSKLVCRLLLEKKKKCKHK